MSQSGQTYANHARFFPAFHFFVAPVLMINFLVAAWNTWKAPSISMAFVCLVALALVVGAFTARVMALRVQDRVIRLEMRLRLRELLAADLQSRIQDLTPEQCVGLRFASDAELPDLVRRALAGELRDSKSIKLAVKNWQGDYLRA